ncbi:Cytochrome c oxidase subunit 5A [Gonapodya sp. JEL0774]|nr:Cytochrome c oxidase subunit 5A [Gonapodya sp. JEL0774]
MSFLRLSAPSLIRASAASSRSYSSAALATLESRWARLPECEQAAVAESLAEKQRGDWKKMTLEEKRAAYYIAYGSYGPRGEDKHINTKVWAYMGVITAVSVTIWQLWIAKPPATSANTPEGLEATKAAMIEENLNPIFGTASAGDHLHRSGGTYPPHESSESVTPVDSGRLRILVESCGVAWSRVEFQTMDLRSYWFLFKEHLEMDKDFSLRAIELLDTLSGLERDEMKTTAVGSHFYFVTPAMMVMLMKLHLYLGVVCDPWVVPSSVNPETGEPYGKVYTPSEILTAMRDAGVVVTATTMPEILLHLAAIIKSSLVSMGQPESTASAAVEGFSGFMTLANARQACEELFGVLTVVVDYCGGDNAPVVTEVNGGHSQGGAGSDVGWREAEYGRGILDYTWLLFLLAKLRELFMGSPFSPDQIVPSVPSADWVNHSQLLKSILCARYGFPLADYEVFETEFAKRFLAPFTSSGKFLHRRIGPPVADFPWEAFEDSMADGVKGFSEANFVSMRNHYAMHVETAGGGLDGRIFLPNLRLIGPQKRIARRELSTVKCTPGVRDLSKTLTALSRTSRVSLDMMMITPIGSRRRNLPLHPTTESTAALKEKFLNLLCDQDKSGKPHQDAGDQIISKVFDSLVVHSRTIAMYDIQVHKALLVLGFEIIRFVWKVLFDARSSLASLFDVNRGDQVESPSFGAIYEELSPSKLVFFICVDLVCETDSYMPGTVYKRLKVLQDDLMEYQMWSDEACRETLNGTTSNDLRLVVQWFDHASKFHFSGKTSRHILPAVADLYGDIFLREMVDIRDMTTYRPKFLQCIMQKLRNFGEMRARSFCERHNIKIKDPESFVSRVVKCTERVLANLSLLDHRHLDTFILCSIHAVAKIVKYGLPLKELKSVYLRQPGTFREAVENITATDNSVGIVEFYNRVFVPTVKHWDELFRSQCAAMEFSITRVSGKNVSNDPGHKAGKYMRHGS